MITNRLTRCEFCYSAFFAGLSITAKKPKRLKVPLPEFQIGERVRTERVCDDYRSANYLGIDWESGFIVGYCWQWDEWRRDEYRQGWTYWIRFDETNNKIFDDRQFLDFVHQSEMIRV